MKIIINQTMQQAVSQGKDRWGKIEIDIPVEEFTQEEREMLALYGRDNEDGRIDLTRHCGTRVLVDAPTPDIAGVRFALNESKRLHQERQRDKERQHQAYLDDCLRVYAERKTRNYQYCSHGLYLLKPAFGELVRRPSDFDDNLVTRRPEIVAWLSELEGINNDRKKQHDDNVRAKEHERELAKLARNQLALENEERLKQWALTNGSQLLRDRITMGFDWSALARKEFVEQHSPDGYSVAINQDSPYSSFESEDMIEPLEEEIAELKLIKKIAEQSPTIYADPEIVVNTYSSGNGVGEVVSQRVEIVLTIICPDQSRQEVYKNIREIPSS